MVSIPLMRPRGVSATFPPSAGGTLPAEVQRKTPRPLGANTLTQLVCPSESVQKNKENGTAYAMPFLFYGFSAGAFVPFAVFGCFAALL